MLRRQALGQLTNHTNNQQQQHSHKVTTKQVTTTSYFKSTTSTTVINDENEIQQQFKTKQNNKKAYEFDIFTDKENGENVKQGTNDDVFDIFCDNNDGDMRKSHQNNKKPLHILQEINKFEKLDSPMVLDMSADTIKFQTNEIEEDLINIDEDDEDDDELDLRKSEALERDLILMNCEEYSADILKYLKEAEIKYRPKANYLKQQQDITPLMRSILIDWLVEVSEEYKLHTETLYLAVNYTDRFLSKMNVLRGKLQLLGTASMYIASKYEEIFPPDISEFVYITDDTYEKAQVLRMEHLILKVLNFQMTSPTANCFLLHYLRLVNANKKVEHLARYLAELTLVEAEPFLEYLPSQIAASALYLSLFTLGKPFTKQISEKIGHQLSDIRLCIRDMHKCMLNAPEHPQQAIQEKYKNERFDCVSLIQAPLEIDV